MTRSLLPPRHEARSDNGAVKHLATIDDDAAAYS